MTSLRSAIKLLGVCILASVMSTGCILAKRIGGQREIAMAPVPQKQEQPVAKKKMMTNDMYTVVAGDCLWCISAKSQIYGDPYKWPLIYRKNIAKIGDADLIYPGQKFVIDRNASPQLIANAIKHAKTRGAWKLGVAEASDIKFIADNP